MRITFTTKVTKNVKFVKFEIPVRTESFGFHEDDIENIKKNFNCPDADFSNDIDEFTISGMVDIDTGKFVNWTPLTNKIEIFEKVVDEGTYSMLDENENVLMQYSGYVPDIFEGDERGYGDYFNMSLNDKGWVKNWHFELDKKIKQFIEEYKTYGDR